MLSKEAGVERKEEKMEELRPKKKKKRWGRRVSLIRQKMCVKQLSLLPINL